MLTYQDFMKAADRPAFIAQAINHHKAGEAYRTAVTADEYDRQRNTTIRAVARTYVDAGGNEVIDDTASNNRLASNFFRRLVKQRVTYLLGNGVSFTHREWRKNDRGEAYTADTTKEQLGPDFDGDLFRWTYKAVIHGVCYGFWNGERLHVFPITGFVPLLDENTGALMAGIRFWQLDREKPLTVELYEAAGRTDYRQQPGSPRLVQLNETPRPYRLVVASTPADGEWVIGSDSFGALPIVPMYGGDQKQSALVGLRENIDAYDIVKSGFANTVSDCAQLYWIIQNCGGMTPADIRKFMDDIRLRHIASVSTESFDGTARDALTPYAQEAPYGANTALLDKLEADMYRDFGALDVHTISASSTNDHVEAAYQPLDEEADALEAEVIRAVQQVLRLEGIDDTPQFKRNRISNVKETVDAIMSIAQYLDDETVLDLVPFITVDRKEAILQRRAGEDAGIIRLTGTKITPEAGD